MVYGSFRWLGRIDGIDTVLTPVSSERPTVDQLLLALVDLGGSVERGAIAHRRDVHLAEWVEFR